MGVITVLQMLPLNLVQEILRMALVVLGPDSQLDYLTPADCGKKCQLDYEINGGRAYLINFSVEGHK
jgi:hypothetical protein